MTGSVTHWDIPEFPTYNIPEELKQYGEGACFMIVRKNPDDPNSELVLIHAFNAAVEQ